MEKFDNNTKAFFALVRAGLWEGVNVNPNLFEGVDWKEVYRLAEEQSVEGLVSAGLDWFRGHDSRFKVPQTVVLQFVDQTLQIEQRNKAMNAFVAWLVELLRQNDIYALLVKGQGIAQCYERPLWRASGDVDLLLDATNYEKAARHLPSIAQSVEKERPIIMHYAMMIQGWEVELHGTMRTQITKQIDSEIDKIQNDIFVNEHHRVWNLNGSKVLLPDYDSDVILIFTHILQHFFLEGVGLRQLCDWCRLLWTYRDDIDRELLRNRLLAMGLLNEWKSLASLAVNILGVQEAAMPFYCKGGKWERKGRKILAYILKTGNFGRSRNMSYYSKYPYFVKKSISFWKHTEDAFQQFLIFPLKALKVWWRTVKNGFIIAGEGR